MAVDADNVVVGVTGAVYVAPKGTTLPTNAAAALNVAFKDLGYVGEEGVQENPATTSTTNIKAWQNGVVVRKVQTEHDTTFQFTLIETKADVLATVYGNHTAGKVEINASIKPRKSWVIDVLDDDSKIRFVIPEAEITGIGTITYANNGVAGYAITLTAYEDPNYAGSQAAPAKVYKYHSTDGAPSA